jgi:hypothetical protein
MVTGNTVRYNNVSDEADRAGIYVTYFSLIKGNTLLANKQNNIYVHGNKSAIEENLVVGPTGNGIYFNSAGNFYANNRASWHVTDYNDAPGNYDGGGNVSF